MQEEVKIKLTKELKLEHWGPGEWIDEPDTFSFEHEGFECFGIRVAVFEGIKHDYLFGGYWCAYVNIPIGHPWYRKDTLEIDADVHGGITFAKNDSQGGFWVGFDCAHSFDVVPSLIKLMSKVKKDMAERNPDLAEISSQIFKTTYRNYQFVVNEVKRLAEQAKKVAI